jgi:hypothetical protein
MSQSHTKKSKQPQQPIVWWRIALGGAILMVAFAAVFVLANWVHSFPSTYNTAPGKILDTRKVVDGLPNSQFGGKILYREAHVQYTLDGQMQDRWLRASDDLPPESMVLKFAAHPSKCLVYWPPKHPENARCSLK